MVGKDIANIVIGNPCFLMSNLISQLLHLSPSDIPPLPNSPFRPVVIAWFVQIKFAAFTCIRLHICVVFYACLPSFNGSAQDLSFYFIPYQGKIRKPQSDPAPGIVYCYNMFPCLQEATHIMETQQRIISRWKKPLFAMTTFTLLRRCCRLYFCSNLSNWSL